MKNLILFLLALIFSTACTVNNATESIIDSKLTIEDQSIKNLQNLSGSFKITNDTQEPIGFGFSSGCQSTFSIYKDGILVFNGRKNLFCTQALTSFELKVSESKTFPLSNDFEKHLEPGNYTIKSYLIGYEDEVFARGSFTVN